MSKKAAIYHFTDRSEKRPSTYMQELARLERFAHNLGYSDVTTFCDMSLRTCDHAEFRRLMTDIDSFDAVITKDFYHLSKNTMKSISFMRELENRGISIHSIENGTFEFNDSPPSNKRLRVATYYSRIDTGCDLNNIFSVQNDILRVFVTKKTCWQLVGQYSDDCATERDSERLQLEALVHNKDSYDLVVVHNFSSLHYRTARLCHIRNELKKDIYSLQEGLLRYTE